MTSALEAAADAYRAAQRRVADGVAEVAAARADLPAARAALRAAIVEAYRSGTRVGEIAGISGYGREEVRRVLRRAGIQAE